MEDNYTQFRLGLRDAIEDYKKSQMEHYADASNRMDVLVRGDMHRMIGLLNQAKEGRTIVRSDYIDGLITQLEMIRRDIVEAEKCGSALIALKVL